MRPKTTPTPIPAEAAGERRVLWMDAVEAEVEAVEVEVGTAAAVLDDTEAEYVVIEMPDVPDVEATAGGFNREDEGVFAGSANGVMVVDKLGVVGEIVVGEIVEAKEEAGEDTGKAFVLAAAFCSIDVKVARASGAGAAQVSLVATEH
jgi:hypothetical protein